MPFVNALRNIMLDAAGTAIGYCSLHTAYPSTTGANEATGGSPAYARKAKTWNAAASGAMDDSNTCVFDVDAGTYRWVGFWSASTAGTFYGYAPLGGYASNRYTFVAGTDVFTVLAHGYADGDTIVFINGTCPTGLTEGTVYYVRDATTDTFKVAATAGGSAIDVSGTPAAASRVSKIIVETFAAQGTHTLTDLDLDLLDT